MKLLKNKFMIIKRDKVEVNWITIFLIALIFWVSFLLYLVTTYGLDWSNKTLTLVIFCNIPTVSIIALLSYLLKTSVYIRTVEFYIHSYDRWNYKDCRYDTLYITEEVSEYQNFIYYKYVGTSTNKRTQLELEDYCNNLPGMFGSFIGYNTKEEAMKSILDKVKCIISDEKSEVNVKIKNVATVETFTIDELKKMIGNK